MKTWYDPRHDRLVVEGEPATPDFWDTMWEKHRQFIEQRVHAGSRDPLVRRTTKRWLKPGANVRVIDGGCGYGQHVAGLARAGYAAFGVDTAPRVVAQLNHHFPDLRVQQADVRSLPFADGFFDGYWSIGVIEHWFTGYEQCAREMARVLKPGGFLFLTFPQLSRLRRHKARRSVYPLFDPTTFNGQSFYQFMLDPQAVTEHFQRLGFRLVHRGNVDGLKGLKDEVLWLKPLLQRLYDNRRLPLQVLKVMLSAATAPWTGHSALLVLRKDVAA